MPIPQLTTFPDPPRIYQPEEEFDAKADEMAGHLPVMVNEINAMVAGSNAAWADINAKTTAATNAATTATNAATAAGTSASNAELFKQAAASSANSAGNSASAALGFKNAAEVSAGNSAANAVYSRAQIEQTIMAAGLLLDNNDPAQLQKSMIEFTKLLGGKNAGSLACIFMGTASVSGSVYSPSGDFTKITRHANFAGGGYLHLKFKGGAGLSMPRIHVSGYEYGANSIINEVASAYLYGSHGVHQQAHTNGPNTSFFYYSPTQAAFILRLKINSAYFLNIRLDAMDAYNVDPLDKLSVASGMFTPITIEAI